MQDITVGGYSILDRSGNELVWKEDFLDAKKALDTSPEGEVVIRCLDGEAMAVAPRNKFRRTVPIARAA